MCLSYKKVLKWKYKEKKLNYNATVMRVIWVKVYIHRSIEQTEGPEKDSHKKSQLIFFYKGAKAINGEKTVFSISEQMGLEQLDVHIPKRKIPIYTSQYIKINWRWMANLNVKCTTIKCLEENIEENLSGHRLGKELLDMTSHQGEKIDKLDSFKIKIYPLQKTLLREWKDEP